MEIYLRPSEQLQLRVSTEVQSPIVGHSCITIGNIQTPIEWHERPCQLGEIELLQFLMGKEYMDAEIHNIMLYQ